MAALVFDPSVLECISAPSCAGAMAAAGGGGGGSASMSRAAARMWRMRSATPMPAGEMVCRRSAPRARALQIWVR